MKRFSGEIYDKTKKRRNDKKQKELEQCPDIGPVPLSRPPDPLGSSDSEYYEEVCFCCSVVLIIVIPVKFCKNVSLPARMLKVTKIWNLIRGKNSLLLTIRVRKVHHLTSRYHQFLYITCNPFLTLFNLVRKIIKMLILYL